MFVYQGAGYYDKRGASTSTSSIDRDASMGTISFAQPIPVTHDAQMGAAESASNISIRKPMQPLVVSAFLQQCLTRSAYTQKSLETFIYLYMPGGDLKSTNAQGKDFVDILPMLCIRDRALQTALLAIGTAALARAEDDPVLIRQSRALYGQALHETAVALRNPKRVKSEAVFAIPRVMALFEILFGADGSTTSQANSWLSHAQGELALIVSWGPEAYAKSDEAHLLFTNARFRPLIAAVRTRKASVLNEKRWKTLSWKGRVKSPDDRLIDILCAVPGILEAVDKVGSDEFKESWRQVLRTETLAKCWALHFKLEAWAETYANEIYSPAEINTTTPIYFPHIEIAWLTSRYWVTALLLYGAFDVLSGISPQIDTTLTRPGRPHPRSFARMIARSVSYFFQKEYGITGATAISFPLGNALLYMGKHMAVDKAYFGMVLQAWDDPLLPSAIRDFLNSMKRSVPPNSRAPTPTNRCGDDFTE